MVKTLIGHSGFVGSTLKKQADFKWIFNSKNIAEVEGLKTDMVICAAAPAQKWIANREPAADRRNIEKLVDHLKKITCKTFVLMSTVDVFKNSCGMDENSPVDEGGLHAYGVNRRYLEKFVQQHFDRHLIVRLPGLVGPGLRKNIIFDFHHDNGITSIDHRSVFQFYPMVNLWYDIEVALSQNLSLVHLTAEPLSVGEVAQRGFNKKFTSELPAAPATYDMRTRYAHLFSAQGHYQYSRESSLLAIRAYAQSEPKTSDLVK